MTPTGDHERLCGVCSKPVHDLSSSTEAAAKRLLAEHRARREPLCIRYMVTEDGDVRFAPELRPAPALAFVMLAGLGAMLLTACTDPSADAEIVDDVCVHEGVMGTRRIARGEDDCPARVELPPEDAPLVWVELEPKPTIPELELPDAPAVAEEPTVTRSQRRPRKREKLKLDDGVQGDYCCWDW